MDNPVNPLDTRTGIRPPVDDIKLNEPSVTTEQKLEKVFNQLPAGDINSSIGNHYFGINHRRAPALIPINRDDYGLTFFTRPTMNMTEGNLRTNRVFSNLLTTNPDSLQQIIRCSFDSQLAKGVKGQPPASCSFVDPLCAFMPFLTNSILSVSGFPDFDVPTYTSPDGNYKESMSFVDGVSPQKYGVTDITVNFKNTVGSPIVTTIATWIGYASAVFMGDLIPYPKWQYDRRIDYQTRIYRIGLDHSKRYVTSILATGASFPVSCPVGILGNFEADKPLNLGNDQVSVNFRSNGVLVNDPILIDQFNRVTSDYFNTQMHDKYRDSMMEKIPYDSLFLFNYQGYPRIDPNTMELEWWIDKQTFKAKLPILAAQRAEGLVQANPKGV
jgi:hypothetical protein